ncbi:hypothetical protein SK803_32145 [Lentzea sp. BCCO 10_0856]|uniref:Uncharacterized protein n=1 Tax=Lentzea miocenica TaxID=3095431 RepID=A0ABU4T9P4_9PSEU|nr:hypothetical protein [Lentzea sp. BCCO 10_0856]MDX8034892.1 hypothetical protein [Lentzea sp. BCCO 10_0856]
MTERASPVFAVAAHARDRGEWHAPTGPWLVSLVDLLHRGATADR